jgi:hypothetical protein
VLLHIAFTTAQDDLSMLGRMNRSALRTAVIAGVLGLGTAAHAGPTLRVGSTIALADSAVADAQTGWGPMIGVGYRLGPVEVEAEYDYITAGDGTAEVASRHLGATLRVQLFRVEDQGAVVRVALDAGIGERDRPAVLASEDAHEHYEGVSLAFGGEGASWMYELRHVSAASSVRGIACLGCTPPPPEDEAWMLEATIDFGR